jgi:hypothetical protein
VASTHPITIQKSKTSAILHTPVQMHVATSASAFCILFHSVEKDAFHKNDFPHTINNSFVMEVPWASFIRFARELSSDLSSHRVMPEEKVWHIDQFRRWLHGYQDHLPSYEHYIRFADVIQSIKAGSRKLYRCQRVGYKTKHRGWVSFA